MKVAFYDAKAYDREAFEKAVEGTELELVFYDFRLSEETASTASGASAVCAFVNDQLDRPCLKALVGQGVKMLAMRCAGFNNLDLDSAKELGLSVVRVPAYSPHAVAEHTLALLMTLNRKVHRSYNRVREQNFSLNGLVGFDLNEKTVGILGTGKIGRVTAGIFQGFNCKVIAHDAYPNQQWADDTGVRYTTLQDLLTHSDIVSLHLPLTDDTYHILDADTIPRMKQGVYLVNTSRGKLIESEALIQTLKSGHLGGVALDVYEEEEGIFFEDKSGTILQDDKLARLMTFPNVLITAHQAFLTREALAEIARVTLANVENFRDEKPPLEGTSL
ncbi:2-hydroxyacid dehydrogenase [Roseibacillus persicicus]|uniref:2-hydroxyacid dehydrogenase n=1 Tax=Roseibacillus persicicus TaxID=454148 RepID=UPI00398ABE7D